MSGRSQTRPQSGSQKKDTGQQPVLPCQGTGDAGLRQRIADADEVVIITGCPVICGAKIAQAQGVVAARHIVITVPGIEKGPSRQYTEEDVETVVSAAWEGKGRSLL